MVVATGRVTYICADFAEYDAMLAQVQAVALAQPTKVKIVRSTRNTRELVIDLTGA